MNDYPKWVQRSQDLGPVLATSEEEEKAFVAHWQKVEKAAAKRAAEDAAESTGDGQ